IVQPGGQSFDGSPVEVDVPAGHPVAWELKGELANADRGEGDGVVCGHIDALVNGRWRAAGEQGGKQGWKYP
ncbi:hypothetical protein, partial [Stenotrophomonas sp. HMWF003]|uniref:hypothetical protein n=1 Tax=Stenotrophomonas sp. HMWF003 TaxID=2056840 RepID=UPI001C62B27A